MTFQLSRWQWGGEVREEDLRSEMRSQGLAPYTWRNGPNDHFSVHSRSYTRVIVLLRGSVTFHFPDTGEEVTLAPGDRLEIPARTRHASTAGPEGAYGLEAAIHPRRY
ncbi:MAG TPA: cupin [Anaerolineae bacterium]|nr:cupin [Anaerolineae bacterium]